MTVIREPTRVYCMACGHLVAMHKDLEGHCQHWAASFDSDHGWDQVICPCKQVKELVETHE